MSAMFIALYVFMPNTHVKISCALVPGILAGIAMQGLQIFYIHSQLFLSSYNAIYGSFAALPLFMLWVQISWTICLFGAELCYTNQNLDYYDYDANTREISHRYRLMLAALLLIVELTSDEKGETSRFMPAEDISRMTVGLMIDRLESYGKWKIDLNVAGSFSGEWSRVIEVRSAYLRESRTILLKDL